jgi:hypothetical protein
MVPRWRMMLRMKKMPLQGRDVSECPEDGLAAASAAVAAADDA